MCGDLRLFRREGKGTLLPKWLYPRLIWCRDSPKAPALRCGNHAVEKKQIMKAEKNLFAVAKWPQAS
jgi:hypothetical protein